METAEVRRVRAGELAAIRKIILDDQNWICPLCERDMRYIKPQQRGVDHDHAKTGPSAGAIRGVLCSNCNGNEGRDRRRVLCAQGHLTTIEWLENLLAYYNKHTTNQTGLVHHTHKTQEEARLKRNAAARKRRAAKKKGR